MAKQDVPKFDDTEPVFEDTTEISPEDQEMVSKYIHKDPVSLGESARAGLAEGGSFGFAPRIGGAMGAAMEKLAGLPVGPEGFPLIPGAESSKDKKLSDLYEEYKQYNQKRDAKAKDANPGTYHAAEFAGALASPLNKIGAVGQLGAEAPMLAKMGQGALAGARMGTLGGLSQSSDLGDIKQDIEKAGIGTAMGGGLGAVAPPIGAGLKAAAVGTANFAKPLIGPVGKMFSRGMQAGEAGAPNLAGEPGQLAAAQDRGEFAKQFVQDLHSILKSNAKNKKELIGKALENSQMAPAEMVDSVINHYLEANPQLNEETARKELTQLKEILLTAKEGNMKTETVRHYNENMPERQLPSDEAPIPLGQVEREVPPGPQSIPGQQALPAGPSNGMGAEDTPTGFEGYKKVFGKTIDKDDEEALRAFHQKVKVKEAEEAALPGQADQEAIEVVPQEVEGYPDKIHLVARRKVIKPPEDEFADQAAKLKADEAQAKLPKFEDIQQKVRTGDRNLQDPQELYNLYDTLKRKSGISETNPGGFSSKPVQDMSKSAAQDIAGIIKNTLPATEGMDARLTAGNNIAESLGADMGGMNSASAGSREEAQRSAVKKVLNLINPDEISDSGLLDQGQVKFITEQLRAIDPQVAKTFEEEISRHGANVDTINNLVKPQTVGGGGPILSSIRRGLAKTSYNVGHSIGSEVRKSQPIVQSGKHLFDKYTPDALKSAANRAMSSGDATLSQFGQVLSKLATADDRTRNSMIFVLEQNEGYRKMMQKVFDDQPTQPTDARSNTVEKYK